MADYNHIVCKSIVCFWLGVLRDESDLLLNLKPQTNKL